MPTKIDLHVHTCYSGDCATLLEEVISYSKRKGLNGVAITDHNTVEGALKLLKMKNTGLLIIPGIEVSTKRGHILGINITTQIPKGLDADETVDRIHEAGGIAVAAHPSDVFKKGIGLDESMGSLNLDAIEVINSSSLPFFLTTYLSGKLAERLHLPKTAGSDSHLPETIGLAYTIIEAESRVEDIIQRLRKGMNTITGGPIPWSLRFKKMFKKREKVRGFQDSSS